MPVSYKGFLKTLKTRSCRAFVYSIHSILFVCIGLYSHVISADSSTCDRACLYQIADSYFDAMVKHDQQLAPLAGQVKFSENGVLLDVGDGLWNTINAVRGYDLKIADVKNGQVARIDVVEEHGHPAIIAARFQVKNKQITEIETVLSRKIDNSPFPVTEGYNTPHPIWSQDIMPAERITRDSLVNVADGYFEKIKLNDGTLFTRFAEDCDRVENGLLTTNTTIPNYEIAEMGCAEQFELGQYIYDDRLRDRRYPIIDEEKGVVLAAAFMDHSGKVYHFNWTDGTPKTSIFHYPHSFILIELFKIEDQAIKRVEAVFSSMPYNTASVW